MKTVCAIPTAARDHPRPPTTATEGGGLPAQRTARHSRLRVLQAMARRAGRGPREVESGEVASTPASPAAGFCLREESSVSFWTSRSPPGLILPREDTWPGVGTSIEGGARSWDPRGGASTRKWPEVSAVLRVRALLGRRQQSQNAVSGDARQLCQRNSPTEKPRASPLLPSFLRRKARRCRLRARGSAPLPRASVTSR